MKISSLLPKTRSVCARIAVTITCASIGSVAVILIYSAASPISPIGLVLGSGMALLAFHLWKLKPWARKAARFLIALSLCVFIGGVFNPFHAMDYRAAHGATPDWMALILISSPFVIAALWCFWALDRAREEAP